MKIFLSYRRIDSTDQTGRIFDHLESRFGKGNVFLDIEGIHGGEEWRVKVEKQIGECDVLISVIGDRWLDEMKKRADENDMVRYEVQAALESGTVVIPALVGNARLPEPDELPSEVRRLADFQAVLVRSGADFSRDISQLVGALENLELGLSAEESVRKPAGRSRFVAVLLVSLIILGGIGAAVMLPEWMSGKGGNRGGASKDSDGKTVPGNSADSDSTGVNFADKPDGVLPKDLSLEEQVHWIFDTHCSRCHEAGDENPELTGTTNLAVLLNEPDYVVAGKPADSILFERVTLEADDSDRMPRSKGKPGDPGFRRPLEKTEIAILEDWIARGAGENAPRETIPMGEMLTAIADDVRAAPEDRQPFLRYFTLTNLYNAAEADGTPAIADDQLDSHRAGLSKMINSLSAAGTVTAPEAIDEARTIYRIDLRDFEWTPDDWNHLVRFYPYGLAGIDQRAENLIERATGTERAHLRADWFVFAASQPPLYHDLLDRVLDIPDGTGDEALAQLEDRLAVDRHLNLREGDAIRAGFQFSGVSKANRLIERHLIGSHRGSYWISYDFSPLGADFRKDLKRAPLGPVESRLTDNPDHVFEHDGGEVIFNLPNGLQGYLLVTAEGKRINRAPIEIVQDDRNGEIINGISCISCHDQGMKAPPLQGSLAKVTDEIGPVVEKSRILDFNERGMFLALHAEPEELRQAIRLDRDRFLAAEKLAVSELRVAPKPVVGLYNEFRAPLTARKLASEFGLSHQELGDLLKAESRRSETLSVFANSLDLEIPLRRESVLRDFVGVAHALGFSLRPFEPLGYEVFGGEDYANLVRDSKDFSEAFGSVDLENPSQWVERIPGAPSRENLSEIRILLAEGEVLDVSIQPRLSVGQRAELMVTADRAVFIRAIHLSSDEFVTELFPAKSGKSGWLRPGVPMEISWETTPPGGPEHILVYASARPIRNGALDGATMAGDFAVMKKDQFFAPRGIPIAIQASETSAQNPVPARIDVARIGYLLDE